MSTSTNTTGITNSLATLIAELRNQLRDAPASQTTFTFQSSARPQEGLTTVSRMRGFELVVDEPADLGGRDQGPNPVELVLSALGTCQAIVYAVYAAALGIRLDNIEVAAEGDIDIRGLLGLADVRPGFPGIRLRVSLEADAAAERVVELVRMVNKHCPVHDVIRNPVPLNESVQLNGSRLDVSGSSHGGQ